MTRKPVDDDLGSAQTTPAPDGFKSSGTPGLAAGSGPDATLGSSPDATLGSGPDSTLDIPAADQVATDIEPGPGAAIGHFIVKSRLGAGGMGVVLACEDADLGRPAAVKLVREEHPAYRARLLREAQAMARLEHPNVVRVYEVGSDRGRLFIAMELVDGDTLTAWLKWNRPWTETLELFLQIAAGLAAVHGAGLVHRDFKPDNVLVDRNGRARVADFGLARLDREKKDGSPIGDTLTRSGAVMGTPGYMAPEQQFGSDVDARADQYSFCVALREALAGRPLDEARWKAVPAHVRAAVARGLSYDADERFASMTDLIAALRSTASEKSDKKKSEPRWAIALLVLAVLGIVTAVVAFVGTRKSSKPAALATPSDAQVLATAPLDAPPAIALAASDAAVVVSPPPLDVASIPVATARRMPKDAGVPAVTVTAPADAAVVTVASGTAPPQLNVDAPTTKYLPEAKPGHAGHLPIVRTAIAGLGYDGFDRTWTTKELQEIIDTASDVERAIAQVKLGMLTRKRGDCPKAVALFVDAAKVLKPIGDPGDEPPKWTARAWMGRALCSLGAGKAADAGDEINRVWVHGDRDEVQLMMGFISYEKGEKDLAYAHLLTAERKTKASVQTALKLWLDGLGLGLHTVRTAP